MDAAERAETRIAEARQAAVDAVVRHHNALLEVERLHNEFLEAEAELLAAQAETAQSNGQASGSAHNPIIRIEPNPNPKEP